MRKIIGTALTAGLAGPFLAVTALGVAFLGGASVASAAGAAGDVPTCLISNGGGTGGFTKNIVCAELRAQPGSGMVGYGRFGPGKAGAPTSITVSVQFRAVGAPADGWVPLAAATGHGAGQIEATTSPIWMPAAGALRACATAQADGGPARTPVCTAG